MTTPEGWYPHPDDELRLRFWDGTTFTDERIWDGSGWSAVEATAATLTPPPFDMERVTLTIVDDQMEPIPPDQLVPPPTMTEPAEVTGPELETEPVVVTSLPPPPADASVLPLPPPATASTLPPPPGRPTGRRTAWFIAAAVIVALFSAGGTYLLVNRDSDEVDTENAAAIRDQNEPDDSDDGAGSTGDPSTTTIRTTTTTTSPSTTLPTTTVPVGPINSWVVVLASVENASGAGAAQQRLAEVRSFAPGAQMLASDGIASLRPGYQVIYLSGYASPDATVTACRSFGLNVPNQCYGRYLSQNPADQDKVAMG